MENNDLPLGFIMALAQNESAMRRFETMTETQKRDITRQASRVSSKSEMQQLVSRLARDDRELP